VSNTSWVSVAAYSDKLSAEAILGLPERRGPPCLHQNRTSTFRGLGPISACSSRRIGCARHAGYWRRGASRNRELTDLATGGVRLDE